MNNFIAGFLPPYFHLWHLPVTFVAGLIAEGYGIFVGGGGVLIQFALAALGMPLANVVATDIAGSIGVIIGTIISAPRATWKKKKLILQLMVPLFLGGIVGTISLVTVPVVIVKYVLIGGLSLLLIYTITKKQQLLQALEDLHIKPHHYPFIFILMFIIGIYGNISGVGVGTFKRVSYVALLHISVADCLGINSIASLPGAVFSFFTTAATGMIVWPYAAALWLGTFIAGKYAPPLARKIPDSYLRILLIAVVTIYLIWLLAI